MKKYLLALLLLLSGTAYAQSDATLTLNWTDNSNNEDGFAIERAAASTGPWTEIVRVAANVTTYQNTGLARGTVYHYRVRAFNAAGVSLYSNTANARTSDVVPTAPSNLQIVVVPIVAFNLDFNDSIKIASNDIKSIR